MDLILKGKGGINLHKNSSHLDGVDTLKGDAVQ